ncbi:MAG: DEAD/DEAH box helicase [Promethearchaeota archaeon]
MSPSLSGMLQQKKYFLIIDKDQDHPRKPYFDFVAFELTKDDRTKHELRYIDLPFFTGLVLFDRESEKKSYMPFKLWKRNLKENEVEKQLRVMDPSDFRIFLINAKFVVVGNHLNKPQGHEFDEHQVVDAQTHEIQENQMKDYLKKLAPVYNYIETQQYEKIRRYLFCHSCREEKKYTLLDEKMRYKNQAFWVCRSCAGKEILKSLKQRVNVTPQLKIYLRDLLKKYGDVVKALNVFGPNFNVLDHPEATLVGVKKKKMSFTKTKKMTIFDYELPAPLRLYYQNRKRTSLLPAQIMALEHGLLENQDELIVSATSSGKTMIGEIAGISKILNNKIKILKKQGISNPFIDKDQLFSGKVEPNLTNAQKGFLKLLQKTPTKKKMLYIVPIVALANMRFREYKQLKQFGINTSLRVGISHISQKASEKGDSRKFKSADVIIATYEAIDIILRSGHPYLMKDLRTIVVDEIQMLADPERGFGLDGLIARLRLYLPKAQMLYLSATISDPKGLATHLRAALIHYQDRPVPIERHLVMCMEEQSKMNNIRTLVREEFKNRSSFGFRGQSIIFTNSRKNTERLADFLSENHIPALAYHGGLDYSQRKFVEKSFEIQKTACVVTTAALAAGVDFAASQVIFFNLSMGIKELTVAEFEQMSGRAGRLKKHDKGKIYCLVIPGKSAASVQSLNEEQLVVRLLHGQIEPLRLEADEDSNYAEILATISMYTSRKKYEDGISRNDLEYFHSMLFNGNFDLNQAILFLNKHKMIQLLKNKSLIRATLFGEAVAESFFKLSQTIEIKKALQRIVDEDNPAPDMLMIAQSLQSFTNVYVTNRILSELSLKNQKPLRSNNLFSSAVLSMIGSEHLGKKHKVKIKRRVFDIILTWSENIFNCNCEDRPYCDCGKRNVEGFIFDYRLSGLSISEIVQTLRDEFEIKVFFGDLTDYLESIIYSLLSIRKIGRSIQIPAQTMIKIRSISGTINQLIGPRKN